MHGQLPALLQEEFRPARRLRLSRGHTEGRMKDFRFHPVNPFFSKESRDPCPKILEEALQVFECTWMKELDGAQNDPVLDENDGPYHGFNGIISKLGAHFIVYRYRNSFLFSKPSVSQSSGTPASSHKTFYH